MSKAIIPLSLKDAPALIERLLPVQKLSAEVYKERVAGIAQTLTALGSYWKGRKPLILAKACILGCLLPATENPNRDLEIFEKLMAMDDESFVIRWKRRPSPREILSTLALAYPDEYFSFQPANFIPLPSPWDWSHPEFCNVKVEWKEDLSELNRRRLEVAMLPRTTYRERVEQAWRPEEVMVSVHDHIWESVNSHLGTAAHSFLELVGQLGIMRFGHRPSVADTFCGSGQIPFEAARLGCHAYASDLNPVACMLTWGSFHIVGGTQEIRAELETEQQTLVAQIQQEIDRLGIETDDQGWQARNFVYCVEVRCPQTGWMVPLIPSFILSEDYGVVAELLPDQRNRRYNINLREGIPAAELKLYKQGTVRSDGRGQDSYMIHKVDDKEYRIKIATLRGEYRRTDGTTGNRLRLWNKCDFKPLTEDLFQERLYAVLWSRPNKNRKGDEYELRAVTEADLKRERIVEDFIADHLTEWQAKGWIPDMRIETGYNTDQPIRERGWTYWHHLFNPRQLLIAGLIHKYLSVGLSFGLFQALNWNSRLSQWNGAKTRGYGNAAQTFYNQALNTFFNYGCRGFSQVKGFLGESFKSMPLDTKLSLQVKCVPATDIFDVSDILITDPPYGDAVNYDEILEFFIAWLRKNPPPEFADWIWDSRRSLAIKGGGEEFRRGMVAAYRRMTECMPENGIQVIMFTHQSGSIWADMANIVWASGLQVTAAWYVVTETESALRDGSYVKGTVLLVCRKRKGELKTTRDDLAWEIQEEVQLQVDSLTGLNQEAKGLYRDENVFEDADIQMAGYAAALRALTRYAVIDGRDMPTEAIRPRVKGETTFVDSLIAFAVDTANQYLVPRGISKDHWDKLSGPVRFYLKMIDMESRGAKTLENYQNFAKAFKVRDFKALMASQKANNARLKSAIEFGKTEMNEGSELNQSVLRAVLYAVMELMKGLDGNDVMAHLSFNISNYYGDVTQRDLAIELADYLAKQLETIRPDEASAARVLRELIKNQRLG